MPPITNLASDMNIPTQCSMHAVCSFYASPYPTKIEGRPFFFVSSFRRSAAPFSSSALKIYCYLRGVSRSVDTLALPAIISMRLRGLANLDVDLMPK